MKTLPSCETSHCPLGKADTYVINSIQWLLKKCYGNTERKINSVWGYEGPTKKKEHEFSLEDWSLNFLGGNGGQGKQGI